MKAILSLFVLIAGGSLFEAVPQRQVTVVNNATAARMLLGRHKLSLQWVSWDYFGLATVTNRRGLYSIKGEQQGRGPMQGSYLTLDGAITSIDAKEFGFRGKIVTLVSHINGGEPCVRDGELLSR